VLSGRWGAGRKPISLETKGVSFPHSGGEEMNRKKLLSRIYRHTAVPEFLCIQDFHGEAKPYQIAQFFCLVEKYTLDIGE
jgi:hypothetical protein